MPTYQYQCTECGEGLEAVQKFTDDALTICESCGGRLRKRFDAIGVTFKGSGFYRTDSRAGATPSGAGSKDSGSSTKESSGSKSEGSSTSPSPKSVSSSSS